jgi:RimJ/RimL family protein N-acetyltransferase
MIEAMSRSYELRLETERLVLRLPRLEDAEAIVPLYSDAVAMEFVGGVHPDFAADPTFVVRRWLERWEANGWGQCVVERRADGAVLGRAGLVVWDTSVWRIATLDEAGEHAQPELGWALAREHWGRGYATEAARAARAWAYGDLGLARLISVVAPANVRSVRVAEKLGCIRGETIELVGPYTGPAVVWVHPR